MPTEPSRAVLIQLTRLCGVSPPGRSVRDGGVYSCECSFLIFGAGFWLRSGLPRLLSSVSSLLHHFLAGSTRKHRYFWCRRPTHLRQSSLRCSRLRAHSSCCSWLTGCSQVVAQAPRKVDHHGDTLPTRRCSTGHSHSARPWFGINR